MFSYDEEDRGACGQTASLMMGLAAKTNNTFDEKAWQDSKQRGSLICPGNKDYPKWPPPSLMPSLSDDCSKDADLGTIVGDDDQHTKGNPLQPKDGVFQPPYASGPQEVVKVKGQCDLPNESGNARVDVETRSLLGEVPLKPFSDAEVRSILEGGSVLDDRMNQNQQFAIKEDSHQDDHKEKECTGLKKFWNNMVLAVKGCGYDLQHWDDLPKKGCLDKLCHSVSRDGRWPYIVIVVSLAVAALLAIIFIVAGLCGKDKQNTQQNLGYY